MLGSSLLNGARESKLKGRASSSNPQFSLLYWLCFVPEMQRGQCHPFLMAHIFRALVYRAGFYYFLFDDASSHCLIFLWNRLLMQGRPSLTLLRSWGQALRRTQTYLFKMVPQSHWPLTLVASFYLFSLPPTITPHPYCSPLLQPSPAFTTSQIHSWGAGGMVNPSP